MTDRPVLLIQAPLNSRLTSLVDDRFETVKLYESDRSAALLAQNANRIRGIVSTVSRANAGVTAALIETLPCLEIIAHFGVGVDSIDLAAAAARHVIVTNTPSVLTDAVADTALLLLLAVTRDAIEADRFVRAGEWPAGRLPLATGLGGKLCGIAGMGRIGQAIATRALSFGMAIAWTGPRPKPELTHRYVPGLVQLADEADVLILAMPGGSSTQRVVTADVLAALGPSGYLINIARGSVVDEPALIQALKTGGIAGAGLDVFENEPHIHRDFAGLANTVLFPHLGSATHETRDAMADLVVENLTRHFAGQAVATPVD